jgi:hypothetical protein
MREKKITINVLSIPFPLVIPIPSIYYNKSTKKKKESSYLMRHDDLLFFTIASHFFVHVSISN